MLFMHNNKYLPLTGILTLLQWTIHNTAWNFWNISEIFHEIFNEIFQGKKFTKFYTTTGTVCIEHCLDVCEELNHYDDDEVSETLLQTDCRRHNCFNNVGKVGDTCCGQKTHSRHAAILSLALQHPRDVYTSWKL